MMLIVPRIYRVLGNKGCNSYILDTDEGLIVIDVGFLGSERAIIKYIDAQLNTTPEDVTYIILTHARRNTAETAVDLLTYCENARLILHKNELPAFKRFAFTEDVEVSVINGDSTRIGRNIEIIYTPGYTQGSLSVLFESSLFIGGSIYVDAKGDITLPRQVYDKTLLIGSLKRLLNYKFENIFPSYGRYLLHSAYMKLKSFINSLE